jgi:hypothetical protein
VGIAFDNAGKVYVVDKDKTRVLNNRKNFFSLIRLVWGHPILSCLVSLPSKDAPLELPVGIAF